MSEQSFFPSFKPFEDDQARDVLLHFEANGRPNDCRGAASSLPGPVYQKFHYMPLPYTRPAESQFYHLRYMAREVLYRVEEQAKTRHLLNVQYYHWTDILPRDAPVPVFAPENPYYCFNKPINPPFRRNIRSKRNMLLALQTASADLASRLVCHYQHHYAVNNRLNYLQVLLQQNMRPSEVLRSELQRKSRYSNQTSSIYKNTMSYLSADYLFIALADLFCQQFPGYEPSPYFERTLHYMSYFYLHIFARLGINEDDVKLQANFERLIYSKVHSKRSNDVVRYPSLVRNVVMKPYQVDCLQFLVSMYNSNVLQSRPALGKQVYGVSLADDMGLGKTLQTIAFMLYLHERRMAQGMHLIISPLPVSESWEREFKNFSTNFNVIVYKGTEREKIRQDITTRYGYYNCIITTYDYVIQDKAFFKKFSFDCVVVDEASRIKNGRSKLISVLRNDIICRFRLLLSGTPLYNNIRELFTLLQFIHGSVFEDFDAFESVFGKVFYKVQQERSDSEDSVDALDTQDCPETTEMNETEADITTTEVATQLSSAAQAQNAHAQFTDNEKLFIIYRLHGIIKPYMIRRVKADVLDQLPPKDEIVLRVPLSAFQRYLYELSLREAGRLIQSDCALDSQQSAAALPKSFIRNVDMYLRKVCNHPYLGVEGEYFMLLHRYVQMYAYTFESYHLQLNDELCERQAEYYRKLREREGTLAGRPRQMPYLQNLYFGDALSRYSGKLQLMSHVLYKMKQSGHRVLVFSYFKLVLNLLADFMEFHGYAYLRFDGDVKDHERNRMVTAFNAQDSKYFAFLLSTRAASHGLNLQSADTVIIYDCDFNAFYDYQAQDRVYRIGQTRAVKVLKLFTDTTLEQKILDIANSKLHMARSILDAGELNSAADQRADQRAAQYFPQNQYSANDTQNAQNAYNYYNEQFQDQKQQNVPGTHFSKREFLLELLRGENNKVGIDTLTNRQINRLIARGEHEVTLFDQIDEALRQRFILKYSNEAIAQNFPYEPRVADFLMPGVPEVFMQNSDALQTLLRQQYIEERDDQKKHRGIAGTVVTTHVAETDAENNANTFDASQNVDSAAFLVLWGAAQTITDVEEMLRFARTQMRSREPHEGPAASFLRFAAYDICTALLSNSIDENFVQVFSGPFYEPGMLSKKAYEVDSVFSLAHAEYTAFEAVSYYCHKLKLINVAAELENGYVVTFTYNSALTKWWQYFLPQFVNGIHPSYICINFHLRLLYIMHRILSQRSERVLVRDTAIEQPISAPFWASRQPNSTARTDIGFIEPIETTADTPTDSHVTQTAQKVSNLSLRAVWFKTITLQYSSLTEFFADVKLSLKLATAGVRRGSGILVVGKRVVDCMQAAARDVFDDDDVDAVVQHLEDIEHHIKVVQNGYALQNDSIGFAAVDCGKIRDAITKSCVFKILTTDARSCSFGSGVYGGGLLEKLICQLVDYMAAQ